MEPRYTEPYVPLCERTVKLCNFTSYSISALLRCKIEKWRLSLVIGVYERSEFPCKCFKMCRIFNLSIYLHGAINQHDTELTPNFINTPIITKYDYKTIYNYTGL